jgi:predicted nucleotidyltransferase
VAVSGLSNGSMKGIAERDAMIERLKECLKGEEASFAFLFGSWARGEIFQESGGDVAVYFQGDYTVEKIRAPWGRQRR